ncbi:MAG: DUF1552 domain-containing protein [Myxococcales bacterium]|nr:DUF1552 domain-containing protein [Myxococcales bacterium]
MIRPSRRSFLRLGAAGSALSLFPWLESPASAADVPPKRIILYYTPHGTVWDQWRPGGGETNFTFSPILTPLSKHRDKIIIVDGAHMISGTEYYIPHTYTMPTLWTGSPIDTSSSLFERMDHGQSFGWNTAPSVDQVIANQLPQTTPYKTLEFGYLSGGLHPNARMIYTGAGLPKNPLDTPKRAFDGYFGAIDPDSGVASDNAARRKSVIDAVYADFKSRRGKLSAQDRMRLEAHANSIREVEKQLVGSNASCEETIEPTGVTTETAMDRQSDLIAAALGCGMSNIASYQHRQADNDATLYPWVGITSGGHHPLSHDSSAPTQALLAKLYTWYAERFAYLLDRLAATPDVNGTTVLDNTLVIWGSELGQAWDHNIDNVPFVLAGGAAGKLRGGRYLKVTNTRNNRILVTAFHAMGLTNVQTFGSLDNGSGPLSGALST